VNVSATEFEPYIGEVDKERLISTYKGRETDRVPNNEILIEDKHVTAILGREAGNTLSVGGDVAKGADKVTTEMRPMYPADYIELCGVIGQDFICLENLWTPIKKRNPDGTVEPWVDRSFRTVEDLDRVVWPGEEDLNKTIGYVREYVEAAKGTRIGVMLLSGCIFQTLYEFVVGLEDFMIMTLLEQDLVKEMLSKSADYYQELHKRAIAEGIDILFAADDVAFKTGLFVAPDIFKDLWRESYQRVLDPALNADVPIKFHSDGKLDDIADMLIDMGIDCLNPMDPYGIDYREYKKRYGNRVTLSGNIDIEFPLVRGTPEEVENDVIEHCEALKDGGRWEFASSHSVVNYIPHENFVTMINAIHKYGRF
jgi:uroporphyrinogen-III decarboxylase